MKKITMFHLYDCKYCDYARQAIKELTEENPEYKNIEIDMVEENEHPEIIENYDYMAVPTLFIGDEKIFEAALFMPYGGLFAHSDIVTKSILDALDLLIRTDSVKATLRS